MLTAEQMVRKTAELQVGCKSDLTIQQPLYGSREKSDDMTDTMAWKD